MAQRAAEPLDDDPPVREATWEEGRAMLDQKARRLLGVSGEEFLHRYDAGEYVGIGEGTALGRAVVSLEFTIPFAREAGTGG